MPSRAISSAMSASSFVRRSCVVTAEALLAGEDVQLGLQVFDAPGGVFQRGGRGVLADGDARAGGVDEADGLVRQLTRRNVAVRQPRRRFQRLVEDQHAVMFLQRRGEPADHLHGDLLAGLLDLDRLEPPGQRGVFFDVFLVLRPGGRRDGAQRAARKGGLEQIGRVARARRAAGADERVRLVDEQG